MNYLPEHIMPSLQFQQPAVSCNHGKESLSRAFADSWPCVDTQLTQAAVQAQPQGVKRCRVVFLWHLVSQVGRYFVSVLREVVRDVPLQKFVEILLVGCGCILTKLA